MQNLTKLIISFFVFSMLWGSCLNTASAKHSNSNLLGRALCNPTTEAIQQAKEYSAFKIGGVLDLSPAKGLTNTMRLEKTVGRVKQGTVLKALLDWDTYINKLRGVDQTAGKIFEESYCRAFNRAMRKGPFFAETTAMLGRPGDAADLLIYEKQSNKLVCKAQQKLSAKEAIKAILNPKQSAKYKDCIILVPSDQLDYIKNHLRYYSPEKQEMLRKALYSSEKFGSVQSPKLTDNILGESTRIKSFYQNATKLYRPAFNRICNEMLPEVTRAIREGSEFITKGKFVRSTVEFIDMYKAGDVVIPEIEKALRLAPKIKNPVVPKIPKSLGSRVLGYAVGVFDVGYGVYMIYDAESKFQRRMLDADLRNYKKLLGIVQIGVGVVEIVAESIIVIEPIVTPVVIVVSIAIVALDMWIDYIQSQRVVARRHLIDRVTTRERPEAIRQLLIHEMDIQCAL